MAGVQVNVRMSREAVARLDSLCSRHRKSRGALIETALEALESGGGGEPLAAASSELEALRKRIAALESRVLAAATPPQKPTRKVGKVRVTEGEKLELAGFVAGKLIEGGWSYKQIYEAALEEPGMMPYPSYNSFHTNFIKGCSDMIDGAKDALSGN